MEHTERYGHGRAAIVRRFKGETFVAVGSRLFHHPKWRTFQDFLFAYVADVFQKDWIAAELVRRPEERHPLMKWYQLWSDHRVSRRGDGPEGSTIKDDAPPAPIIALLALAYDLYTLEHNASLPDKLVKRLRLKDQFQGARYEAYVAAAFIRAGFTITLEDEGDPSSSHVEFTAVHAQLGSKYSVEAKSRHRAGYLGQAGAPKPLSEIQGDIRKLLVPALRKQANYDRIVFIDVNVPPSDTSLLESDWFNKIGSQFNRMEKTVQGEQLPPAIVIFTNFPYHFVEAGAPLRGSSVSLTGFNMPEFRPGYGDRNVLQNEFPAIAALCYSVNRHTAVPHDLFEGLIETE